MSANLPSLFEDSDLSGLPSNPTGGLPGRHSSGVLFVGAGFTPPWLPTGGGTLTGDLFINPSGVPVPEFVAGTTLSVSSAGASGQVSCQLIGFGAAPQYYGARAQGSPASPSALNFSGFNLFAFASAGYHSGGAWSTPQNFVQLLTAEPWTATAQGTTFQISTTPSGSTVSIPRIIANQTNVELRGSSGVAVRNQDGSADGPLTASTATLSTSVIVGTNIVALNYLSAGVKLVGSADIEFAPTNINTASDLLIIRNAVGQLDVRGDSGLRVRNLANTADAPISASNATLNGSLLTAGSGSLGTPGTPWAVTYTGLVRLGVYIVATLPSASANVRARVFVSDSSLAFNSANLGATVTAGGTNLVPVWSNGTNWVIG